MKKKKCLRCGYEWISLVENPKVCPSCKSYKWKEKRKRNISQVKEDDITSSSHVIDENPVRNSGF